MNIPRVAITMGDPAGVGPEICLRALREPRVTSICHPVVFGDAAVLARVAARIGIDFVAPVVAASQGLDALDAIQSPSVFSIDALGEHCVEAGQVSATTGAASFRYIQTAIDAALAHHVAAITTGPIQKEALHQAGIQFPGHTEMFAARCGSDRWCMMQYAEDICCTFVTVHVGYAEVPQHLTTARILEVIELTGEGLQRIRQRPPRIVVCGLNPHAGEHGLFGNREEERLILPAIEQARAKGWHVEGPLPPDTVFVPHKRAVTDAVVCMYHDQGHIPIKALAFDRAVNTTLGLSLIRTSVDHGTALDIAWRGIANPGSLFHALELAVKLSRP